MGTLHFSLFLCLSVVLLCWKYSIHYAPEITPVEQPVWGCSFSTCACRIFFVQYHRIHYGAEKRLDRNSALRRREASRQEFHFEFGLLYLHNHARSQYKQFRAIAYEHRCCSDLSWSIWCWHSVHDMAIYLQLLYSIHFVFGIDSSLIHSTTLHVHVRFRRWCSYLSGHVQYWLCGALTICISAFGSRHIAFSVVCRKNIHSFVA